MERSVVSQATRLLLGCAESVQGPYQSHRAIAPGGFGEADRAFLDSADDGAGAGNESDGSGGNRRHDSTANATHDPPLAEAALARALLAHASKAVHCANPVSVRLFRMPTLVRI